MNQIPKLNQLCSEFEGTVEKSDRRFYIKTRMDPVDLYDPEIHYKAQVVGGVCIHIPEHKLDDFMSMFTDRKYQDMEIRLNVPAVKKAYEHYNLLLNMCRGDQDAGY